MKNKLTILGATIFFILGACQNLTSEENKDTKDNYSIKIEGLFKKNDKLEVYYLVDDKNWNEENSISKSIYASNKMQDIILDLPKGINLKNLRIDLGVNPSQSHITIKNISILFKDKVINGENEQYLEFFTPNEFVTWDMNYYGYKLSSVNGTYDPYLTGTDLLMDKIEVEFK